LKGARLPTTRGFIPSGYSSHGRLEKVLRAGGFASLPSWHLLTLRIRRRSTGAPHFDQYVDAINATDGSGANCHMSSLAVCATVDARRI